MEFEKHLLKSKTIWGSLISLLSFIIVFITVHDADGKYFAISGAISSAVSIYGRIKAKETLYVKKKKDSNN